MRHFLILFSLLLAGCDWIQIGATSICAGVVVGYEASKEVGVIGGISDFFVYRNIREAWKAAKLDEPFLEVVVVNGVAVIVGAAITPEGGAQAVALAYSHASDVHNLSNNKLGKWNRDLEFAVNMRLTFSLDAAARNYHVYSIKNHVWIIGIARSKSERDSVIEKVKGVADVKSVSHHILIRPGADNEGYILRH